MIKALLAGLLCLCGIALAQTDGLELGIPSTDNCELVHHTGYSLCYSEKYEQSAWVAYKLTKDEVGSTKASRYEMDFEPDPSVTTHSASKDDYRNSGFDKGHLVPAADLKWGKRAMRESFFTSNISPQLHEFNAGIWETLEKDVRAWAVKFGEVYVVTGPVLRDGLPTIGANHVAVPEYFYKIVLYRDGMDAKAVGFVMPNQRGTQPVSQYAVTVDSVESLTGLNFFNALPLSIEQKAEASVDSTWWFSAPVQPPKHRTRKHR
jgi:endonuclease G